MSRPDGINGTYLKSTSLTDLGRDLNYSEKGSGFNYESGGLARSGSSSKVGLDVAMPTPFKSSLTPDAKAPGSINTSGLTGESLTSAYSEHVKTDSNWRDKYDKLGLEDGGDPDPRKTRNTGSDWAADTAAIGGLGLGFLGYLQNAQLMKEQIKGMRQNLKANAEYNQRMVAKNQSINSALKGINTNPRQQST